MLFLVMATYQFWHY